MNLTTETYRENVSQRNVTVYSVSGDPSVHLFYETSVLSIGYIISGTPTPFLCQFNENALVSSCGCHVPFCQSQFSFFSRDRAGHTGFRENSFRLVCTCVRACHGCVSRNIHTHPRILSPLQGVPASCLCPSEHTCCGVSTAVGLLQTSCF